MSIAIPSESTSIVISAQKSSNIEIPPIEAVPITEDEDDKPAKAANGKDSPMPMNNDYMPAKVVDIKIFDGQTQLFFYIASCAAAICCCCGIPLLNYILLCNVKWGYSNNET